MSTNIRGDQTRKTILDTAWTLISDKGADVSLGQIAKTCGITRQALYLHFGTRAGLLTAIVRRTDERLDIIRKLTESLECETPRDRVAKFADAWFDFVLEIYPVASDLIRLRAKDEDAAIAWSDRMSELKQITFALVKTLERDGVLAPHWRPRAGSEFVWTLISVQVWGLLTNDCGWPEEDARNHLKNQIIHSLIAHDQI